MKKAKKRLLAWSIGSGLLLSSTLYSGVSLAYVNKANFNNYTNNSNKGNGRNIKVILDKERDSISILNPISEAGVIEVRNNSDLSDKYIEAFKSNLSALYIKNEKKFIGSDIRIKKRGDTSSLFQTNTSGLNSGILFKGGDLNLSKSIIKTESLGSKGIYVSNKESRGFIDNTIIETSGNDSTGLEVADGSNILTNNIAINTTGNKSIGIAVSNQGVLMNNKGYVFTTGDNSPAFYSGGTMIVNNTDLDSRESFIGVVEGGSNIAFNKSNLKGKEGIKILNHMPSLKNNIVNIKNSLLSANNGPIFKIENSSSVIKIEDSEIKDNDVLVEMESLTPQRTNLFLDNQRISGEIKNDINSDILLTLNNKSYYKGCIKNGASICLDSNSIWELSGDSHVGKISIKHDDESLISKNIKTNGYLIKYEIEKNEWLGGKKIKTEDGGWIEPA